MFLTNGRNLPCNVPTEEGFSYLGENGEIGKKKGTMIEIVI